MDVLDNYDVGALNFDYVRYSARTASTSAPTRTAGLPPGSRGWRAVRE